MNGLPSQSRELLPREDADNALSSFLGRVVPYEKAGAVIPTDLLQFGLYGSVVVIVTGLVAGLLPSPESIREGGFFLVLDGTAADITALMKSLAIPAIVAGVALLLVDLVLMKVRTSARWRSVIVVQATAAGGSGVIATIFLALLLLNLVLWVIIVTLVLVTLGFVLSAIAGG